MDIQLQSSVPHAIQSYDNQSITVNDVLYESSTIISTDLINNKWPVHSVTEINDDNLSYLLTSKPEIIIIGHSQSNLYLPPAIIRLLSKQRIGIECMSIGAACRTFNVLLSEQRAVVLGIVLRNYP